MLILDSDHLNVLTFEHERADRLEARLVKASEEHEVVTTIINVQEKLAGWLSKINRKGLTVEQQVPYYDELQAWVRFFHHWVILSFDQAAAAQYQQLSEKGIRGKTMDLKIAAIALCHDATVLTRNLEDFRRIPDLKVEDWLLEAV